MSDVNEQAEKFIKIFSESGLIIDLGAQYSVKGQVAQLINGCKKLTEDMQAEIDALKSTNEEILQETKDALVRMQGKIDALKSDDPFGWWVDDTEKYSNEFFMKNKRSIMGGPNDEWEEKYKDQLTPLFKSAQPIHKPLTNEEIEKILIEIPDWDDYEYTMSFARSIETKVRSQYEI